jgi:polyphosphate kinase
MLEETQPFDPRHFLNRELSWLEFNQRVLDEARDPRNPLLERVKFFSIVSSNLDEFFEVRVAGIKQQIESDIVERSLDGLTASECFAAITRRVRALVDEQYRCWREELVPALDGARLRFLRFDQLDGAAKKWIGRYYQEQVRPVLTPLGIDPAHPFPQLLNKSLNYIVRLEITERGETRQRLAVVQVPRILPRLVLLPGGAGTRDHLLLGQLIGNHLADLFPGTRLLGHWLFRVTRNSELYIDEEESGNLLKAVENEVHNRRKGAAVRLEVAHNCPADVRALLLETLGLTDNDLYAIDGPIDPVRLMALCDGDHSPELRDPPFLAPVAAPLREAEDVFAAVRERDVLLHHPYESFGGVVDFLQQAAADPKVLAIKQTLYRTGGDLRVIGALMDAARNGKQVTAVVELKARFDEANNIQWARQLEEAGVHVVYGLVGYKIHCKLCLVVRHEGDAIRRYVHLGTGNYNPATAKVYTDLGLLTCHAGFAAEAGDLFNLLTGVCQFQGTQKLLVAPFNLHERMTDLILRETANARAGLPARVIAKMNSLVDPQIIAALYAASQAGVKVDLIVRGICCLRPGVKGLSENITVRSIVGRFLEHSRVFYFENACQPEVFLGSADWMPRNFFRRIEVVFPVEDGNLRERVINEILELNLADNMKARSLDEAGRWRRVKPAKGAPPVNCQAELMRRALLDPAEIAAATTPARRQRKYPKVKLRARPAGKK